MGQPVNSKNDIEKYFSNELKNIFERIWDGVLEETGMPSINTDVFLYYVLSEQNCILYKAVNGFLNSYDIKQIQEEYSKKLSPSMISGIVNQDNKFSLEFRQVLIKANEERIKLGNKLLTSDHILCALLKEGKAEEFVNKGLKYDRMLRLSKKMHDITDTLVSETNEATGDMNIPGNMNIPGIKMQIIGDINDKDVNSLFNMMGLGGNNVKRTSKTGGVPYCTNLNKEPYEPILGRKREVEKILNVLNRRKCNNAVIVGESGVGKTSVVRALVNLINSEDCPSFLSDKIVYRLNPYEMVAGTQLRGMFEERLNSIISAFNKNKNYILFIDDFHNMLGDKQQNEYDFIGGMSEMFRNGSVKIIATTTQEGYKSGFEKTDLSKIFQRINIDQPSVEECIEILDGVKETYEEYHHVKYESNTMETIVSLSKRYITEKTLPSSAIDILDEAGARKHLSLLSNDYIREKKANIKALNENKVKLMLEDRMEEVKDIDTTISGLMIMLNEEMERIEAKDVLGEVTENDIYETISEHTGIPLSKLSSTDKESVRNIGNTLKKSIIGQDEAMNEISKVIKRNKVGLFMGSKPIGSFMYVGESGVGKTLTAKILAKEIFGDEKYLVRFDMSEYADKTAVNKLIGASAGYIGYDKGGLLTESVKRNKHCVLLIDEIEKADEEVYNLFLQILDEGHLTDNVGYKVDFKNTIIIFTSNIGTKEASMAKTLGFNVDENINKKDIIVKNLKKKFPPEFINRLDKVVYFNTLTDENIKSIISLEISKLTERVNNIGYTISIGNEVNDFLFRKIDKNKGYGARPVIRIIQNEIENRLADILLEDDNGFKNFICSVDNGKLEIKKIDAVS